MRWLLISFQGDLGNFGVRYLSSALRAAENETRILFIPHRSSQKLSGDWITQTLAFIDEHTPDMIGISLMCCHYHDSSALTKAIHDHLKIPVVWGGLHPTLSPEECILECDMLCRGEGEIACVELATALKNGCDYRNIQNFWFREGATIIRNALRPHNQNLDALPFPDYDFEHQFVYHKKRIQPLTYRIARHYPPYNRDTHFVLSSRGCSFRCAYCCSPTLADLAPGRSLRRRSPESVVSELEEVVRRFPRLQSIVFCDDDFIAADGNWFDSFEKLYSSRIGLPFMCAGNPVQIREKTIRRLIRIGLVGIGVGIQSYNSRVRNVLFRRPIPDDVMDQAIQIVSRHDYALKAICYDFIVDIPGVSEAEAMENIRRLNRIKKDFTINIFPLTSYPGSELDRRLGEGNRLRDGIYRLSNPYRKSFLNRLLRITPHTHPDLVSFFMQHNFRTGRALFKIYYFFVFVGLKNPLRKISGLARWFGHYLAIRLGLMALSRDRFRHFKFEN